MAIVRFVLTYWSDTSLEKEVLLESLIKIVVGRRYVLQLDDGWRGFDLKISRGLWVHAFVLTVVYVGNEKFLWRLRCGVCFSWWSWLFLSVDAALIAVVLLTKPSHAAIAAAVGLFALAATTWQMLALSRALKVMIDAAALQSDLRRRGA